MNVRPGFGALHHTLTGEPVAPPTERQKLMARIAEQRRKHQATWPLVQQLREVTHAELEEGIGAR